MLYLLIERIVNSGDMIASMDKTIWTRNRLYVVTVLAIKIQCLQHTIDGKFPVKYIGVIVADMTE